MTRVYRTDVSESLDRLEARLDAREAKQEHKSDPNDPDQARAERDARHRAMASQPREDATPAKKVDSAENSSDPAAERERMIERRRNAAK